MPPTGPALEIRSIILSPHLAEVSRGRAMLATVAADAGFPEERVFDITVACSEAMANAIEHSPVKGEVQVRALLRPDRLEVEVRGPGEFQAPDRLGKHETRGLGLPLMAKLSDHLALFSGPGGETFVSLTFYRPGVQPPRGSPVAPTFANLAEENRLLDDVLTNFPDRFYALDEEGRILYANPAVGRTAGRPPEELTGAVLWKAFEGYEPIIRQKVAEVRATGASVTFTTHRAGVWEEVTAFPVEEGVALISRDITARVEAEGRLQERSQLLDLSFEAIFAWELDGHIRYWNRGAEAMYGFSAEEAVGKVSHDLLATRFPFGLAELRDTLQRDGLWSGELKHRTKDRRTLSVESRQQLMAGDRALVLETNRDITERTRAAEERELLLAEQQVLNAELSATNEELAAANEELAAANEELTAQAHELVQSEDSLRQSEERFRSVLDSSLDGIYRVNLLSGRYEYVSAAFGPTLGHSNEEFLLLSPHEAMLLVHPDDLPRIIAALSEAETGQPMMVEYRILGTDGRYRWVSNHFSQTLDAEGRPLFRDGVVRDISEQKLATEAIEVTNAQLTQTLEGVEELSYSLDYEWDFLWISERAAARYGKKRADMIGRNIWELFPALIGTSFEEHYRAAMERREIRRFEAPGTITGVWYHVSALPSPPGITVFGMDISERKRVEGELRRSEEQQTFLLDLSDKLRSLDDPIKIQEVASRAVGEWFGVDRVFYADLIAEGDGDGDDLMVERDYHAPGLRRVRGRIPLSVYSERDNRDYRAGRTAWSSDVDTDPMLTASERAAYRANKTRAYIGAPIIKQGRLAAVLGIAHSAPREWRLDEINFADRAADRIWRELERARAETALRSSEQNYRHLFNSMDEGFFVVEVIFDEDGHPVDLLYLEANAGATRMVGMDWSGKRLTEIDPHFGPYWVEIFGEVARTGQTMRLERYAAPLGRWWSFHVFTLGGPDSGRLGTTFTDITERKHAEEEQKESEERGAFVLALTDSLRPVADPIAVQEKASRLLGEYLRADRVTYFEVKGDDYVVEHDYAPSVPHLSGRYPIAAFGERLLAIYRAGRMVVSNDIAQDPIPPAERDSFFSIQVHAQISVPLIKNGEFVAGLAVHSSTPRTWTLQEMQLIEDAAERTWAAVEQARAEKALRESEGLYRSTAAENERLYRQQLKIAESLQSALLSIPSEIGPLRVRHLYRSATEAAKVGGDFYDVFQLKDGKIALLVGDVSGHGIQAARSATLVKDVVHAFAHQSTRPQEVVRRTNTLLVEKNLPGFVSLFFSVLDTAAGTLRYVSAGHPETLLRRTSGETQLLGSGSLPLGVDPDALWKPGMVQLQPGDLLLLYTDGVLEARRGGEFFGLGRLEAILQRKRLSVERLPHTVLDQVLAFSGGKLSDDIAMLAVLLTES